MYRLSSVSIGAGKICYKLNWHISKIGMIVEI